MTEKTAEKTAETLRTLVDRCRDQLEGARRVVECRAGAMLDRGKLSAARLRSAVEEARGCAGRR